jgi:endo-alpha-1,4-polygalactosaminidase (GH114 family)
MLTYCFESSFVPSVLSKCRINDLVVVDTEGCEKAVREAVSRGVWVYGYLNIGALEKQRTYAEPIHYTLTPQQILTLKGINNVYSDTNGQMEIKYWKH